MNDFDARNSMEMLEWANRVIASREPDQIIRDDEFDEYMRRWYAIPRNPAGGCYIHQIVRSDKDVHHDHPWDNTSYVLDGFYYEECLNTATGKTTLHMRQPGQIVHRKAKDAHRIILPLGQIVTTLFIMGPKVRNWGFHCPGGWVPWEEFVDPKDKGRIGRGCGEHG